MAAVSTSSLDGFAVGLLLSGAVFLLLLAQRHGTRRGGRLARARRRGGLGRSGLGRLPAYQSKHRFAGPAGGTAREAGPRPADGPEPENGPRLTASD